MNPKRQRIAEKHAIQQSGIEKIDNYLEEVHNLKNMPEQISEEDNVYLNRVFSEKQLSIEDYRIRGLKCSQLKISKEERIRAINSVFNGYKKIEQPATEEPIQDKEIAISSGRGDNWLKKQRELSAQATN